MPSSRAAALCEHAQLPDNAHRAVLRENPSQVLVKALVTANSFTAETLRVLYPSLRAAQARALVVQSANWMSSPQRQVILELERRTSVLHALLDLHTLEDADWAALVSNPSLGPELGARVLVSNAPASSQALVLGSAGRSAAISWFAANVDAEDLHDEDFHSLLDRHHEGPFNNQERFALAVMAWARPALVASMLEKSSRYYAALALLPWDERSGPAIASCDDRDALIGVIVDATAPAVQRAKAWAKATAADGGAQLRLLGIAPLSVQPDTQGVSLEHLDAAGIDQVLYRSDQRGGSFRLAALAANPALTADQADRILHVVGPVGAVSWAVWSKTVRSVLERFPALSEERSIIRSTLERGRPDQSVPYRPKAARHRFGRRNDPYENDAPTADLDQMYAAESAALGLAHAAADLTVAQWQVLFGIIEDFEGTTSELAATAASLA